MIKEGGERLETKPILKDWSCENLFFRGVLGIQMKISCSQIMPAGLVGVLVTSRLTQSTCFFDWITFYVLAKCLRDKFWCCPWYLPLCRHLCKEKNSRSLSYLSFTVEFILIFLCFYGSLAWNFLVMFNGKN